MIDDKKKITFEIVKKGDWLNFPPRINQIEEGKDEPLLFTKPGLCQIKIAIKDIDLYESFDKGTEDNQNPTFKNDARINGIGNMSGVRSVSWSDGLTMRGDTISFFDGKPHDKINVSISQMLNRSELYQLEEDTEIRGIDIGGQEWFDLSVARSFTNDEDKETFEEEFYLSIYLKEEFINELCRRIRVGEIKTLGISLDDLDKVPGLYTESDPYGLNMWGGKEYKLLDNLNLISNLTKEEYEELPGAQVSDAYRFQLIGNRFSLASFSISFNPTWLLDEMFEEEQENEEEEIFNGNEESNEINDSEKIEKVESPRYIRHIRATLWVIVGLLFLLLIK